MEFNKLIYDVRESLLQYTDDSNLSDEYIGYLINIYRAEVLKNELNNFQRNTNYINIQSFCVEFEEVSAYDCNIDIDCKTIMRSKQVIPNPIKTHLGYALTKVRSLDKLSKPMSLINEERLPYFSSSKFHNSIYYYLGTDSYLYLVSKSDAHKLINCVTVEGVFADPLDLENYKTCCGCKDTEDNKCYDVLKSDYPITSDQVRLVIEMIIQRLANRYQIQEDTQNNSNDQ